MEDAKMDVAREQRRASGGPDVISVYSQEPSSHLQVHTRQPRDQYVAHPWQRDHACVEEYGVSTTAWRGFRL